MFLLVVTYFNSIKVQLELFKLQDPNNNKIFQFHKGTIRTDNSREICVKLDYFNSIKVQLEPVNP